MKNRKNKKGILRLSAAVLSAAVLMVTGSGVPALAANESTPSGAHAKQAGSGVLSAYRQIAFGSTGVALDAGTYILPASLKNATQPSQNSAAASCIGKTTLTVREDGTARITVEIHSVTVAGITAWARDWKVYTTKDTSGTPAAADYTVNDDGNVDSISFDLPDNSWDGVYVNMYVDAMKYAPDAWLKFDFANAYEAPADGSEKASGSAVVEQFGEYTVHTVVTTRDNRITNIEVSGDNFSGNYAEDNKAYLARAIRGLKDAYVGKSAADAKDIESVDAVSGATYASNAIRDSILDALHLKATEEVIHLPSGPLEQGEYQVDISFYTDIVTHYLTGKKQTSARISVDKKGNMKLITDITSGTVGEPLYVTAFNGYYPQNDASKALRPVKEKKTTVAYSDSYFPAGTEITDQVEIPLEGPFAKTYLANVHLYVPAMNRLNGEISGITFSNGWFDIDCMAKIYWDTLKKTGNAAEPEKKGTVFSKGGLQYKVTDVSGRTASVTKLAAVSFGTIAIPGTVTYKGRTYKVTKIAKNACRNNKKATKLVIGANVRSIGTSAFQNCTKLKTVIFKGTKVTAIGRKAFSGTSKNITFKTPKKSCKKYSKLLKKSGISQKAEIDF